MYQRSVLKPPVSLWLAVAILAALSASAPVRAQDADAAEAASVEQAEQLLVDLEYERALEVATAALEGGGNSAQETARLLELIGLSASFVENEDRAFEAYSRVLALNPEAEIDASVPPDLRAPFLRARGWWAAQREGFSAEVRIGDPGAGQSMRVLVELNDPLRIARGFVVSVRPAGGEDWQEIAQELAGEERHVLASAPLELDEDANPREIELTLRTTDEHGNQLTAQGSELEPVRMANPRYRDPIALGSGPVNQGPQVYEEWWFWTLIGAVVVGAGLGFGLYFGLPPQLNGQTEVVFGL